MRGGVVLMAVAWATLAWGRGGHDLTDHELQAEIAHNHALAAYIDWNGMPDVAESRFLSDQPPWDDHEVTLYYLDARKEIAFARAWILGAPTVQIKRYERRLSAKQVDALSRRARKYNQGPTARAPEPASGTVAVVGSGPDQRAEAAARRAEAAAARVETAAASAERAAEHTEAVTAQMGRAVRSVPRK